MTYMIPTSEGMRFPQKGNPNEYSTFSIHAPLATHWRKATCQEVDCPEYRNGWGLRVEHHDAAVLYAAEHSGRKFYRKEVSPGENWLVFEAGQKCFQAENHRKKIERDDVFVLRRGDFRRYEDPHKLSSQSWVDSFGENQENINAAIQRG